MATLAGNATVVLPYRRCSLEQLWEGACRELRERTREKPYLEETCRRAFAGGEEAAFGLIYSLFHQPGRSLVERLLARKDPTLLACPLQLERLGVDVLAGLCESYRRRGFVYHGLPQLFGYLDGICTRVLYARGGLRERRQKIVRAIKSGLPLDERDLSRVRVAWGGEVGGSPATGKEAADGAGRARPDGSPAAAGKRLAVTETSGPAETNGAVAEEEGAFERLLLLHTLAGGKLAELAEQPAVRAAFDGSPSRYVNQFLYNRQQTALWHFYVRLSALARDPANPDWQALMERLVPSALRAWKWREVPLEEARGV